MTLEHRNRLAVLYDLYGCLLTEKQQDMFDLYYLEDYSFGEIADRYEISRTAVYDLIKRTEQLLEKYETKMHLAAKESRNKRILVQLESMAEGNEAMKKLIQQLSTDEENSELR